MKSTALHLGILLAGLAAPFLFPAHTTQVAVLWIFILFALTWDIMGGQMGYNSLGNILFFGFGMYVCAIVQIGMFYDVAEYTAAFGAIKVDFTNRQYYMGLVLGLGAAAVAATVVAVLLSWVLFGLRGPYFAIGTLGAAIAAAVAAGAAGGGYHRFEEAQARMTSLRAQAYQPDPDAHAVYDSLYGIYRELHDVFGGVAGARAELATVMKRLLAFRERTVAAAAGAEMTRA